MRYLAAVACALVVACQSKGPVPNPSPASHAMPYFYARELGDPTQLAAFDWSGRQKTTIPMAEEVDHSPWLAVFRDAAGHEVPDLWRPFPWYFWADDDLTRCDLDYDYANSIATLSTLSPGQAPRQVAKLTWKPGSRFTTVRLAACSIRSDRAIATESTNEGPTDLWIVRLSDGKTLVHRTYDSQNLTSVVASPDGSFVAENSGGAASTVVRQVKGWRTVLRFDGNVRVSGFSDDNSRVLTVREPLEPPGSIRSEIIDRSSKRAVWTNDGYEEAISFVARTGTADLVLALRGPAMLAIACPAADICWRFSNSRLLVVRQDGSTSEVAGRYLTDW